MRSDLEERTFSQGPADDGGAVKIAIGGLHKRTGLIAVGAVGLGAEIVKRGEYALWSHFVDSAALAWPSVGASQQRGGIKVPITSLNQAVGKVAIGAVRKCAEVIDGGHAWSGTHFVDRASTEQTAASRGAIDAGVCSLKQSRARITSVGTAIVIAKAVQRGDGACGRNLDGGAISKLLRACVGGAGVEVSIDSLRQRVFGGRPVGAIEALNYREGLCGRGCSQQNKRGQDCGEQETCQWESRTYHEAPPAEIENPESGTMQPEVKAAI